MNNENAIEWYNGDQMATVSACSKKYANKLRKLYASDHGQFGYFVENGDGSVCANIPLSWIKISKPRQISEEQKAAAAERLRRMKAV